MESQSEHITRLIRMVSAITNLSLPDNEIDYSEALWYEPWNLILNWLRGQTSLDLTIGPQYRLISINLFNKDTGGKLSCFYATSNVYHKCLYRTGD